MKKKNIIFVAVALLMLTGVVLWWLNKAAFQTPQQLAPMPAEEFADNPALKVTEEEYSLFSPQLNTTTIKKYLDDLTQTQPAKLYWKTKYEIFAGDATFTEFAEYKKSEATQTVKQYNDKGTVQYTYSFFKTNVKKVARTGESVRLYALSRYTPSRLLHMPELTSFYSLSPEDITSLCFSSFNEQPVLYLEFQYSDLQITEKYWISTEYGVPLKAETYIDGVLSHSTTTVEINSLGTSSQT